MKTYTIVLKHPNRETSKIMMILRDAGERKIITLPIYADPKNWDADSQKIIRGSGYRIDNEIIDRYRLAATEAIREDALCPSDLAHLHDAILVKLGKKKEYVSRNLFLPYYKKWSMTSTTVREATRQMMYSYRLFEEYAGQKKLTFDDMTYSLVEDYIEWMADKGLSVNTRGGHVKRLKTAMHEAYNNKLHNNEDFKRFRKETEEVDNVYLTSEELEKIEAMELCGAKEVARDLFIIGCYTAMRFSDYSRLTSRDIIDGLIRQVNQKTKERVIIPAHPKVVRILAKYDGPLKISQQKLNSNIKIICRDAGITDKMQIVRNGKVLEVEKWELVSSHTARRTAATNMFKAGIPSISIMKITGHRTEGSFMKYIKIDKEENAEMLRNNPFFK